MICCVRWLTIALVLYLAGCGQDTIPSRLQYLPPTEADYSSPVTETELEMVFLGTGGIFLRNGDQALLGDPFFSNPPIPDWILNRHAMVKKATIDRYLPPLDSLRAILVAHVHHDHAMDVPYIALKLDPAIKVYGSETLRNTLYRALDPARLESLNTKAAGPGLPGEWVPINDSLRILPILSGHAPHLFGRVFNSDKVKRPLDAVPQTVLGWESGQTLSFVIDFLRDGQPHFRVYYQSSAADAPNGMPPDGLLEDGKSIDLALLGVANHNRLQEYPVALLQALQPSRVVLLHWEVFWDTYSQQSTEPLPGLDLAGLVQKLERALPPQVPVYLPGRGARILIQEAR